MPRRKKTLTWGRSLQAERLEPRQMLSVNTGSAVPGDYTVDGAVNASDLTAWKSNFGSKTNLVADGNGNGVVDGSDFLIWQRNFGANLGLDFGDAPLPYQTTLAENGPRHVAVGPILGEDRSSELDGKHSNGAFGDATDNEGIFFELVQVGADNAQVLVQVQGGPAKLDAWIDFNGDGSFSGTSEKIFSSVDVVAGNNELSFAVPSTAITGELFARFRLSTAGGLEPTGPAADGEVEDLNLTVLAPIDDSFVPREPISASKDGANNVIAVDVDGDGDMDAVSAAFFGNKIAWHENDGAGNFTEHLLPTPSNQIAHGVTAADIDGDGDIDIVATSSQNDAKLAWFENDGAENFTRRPLASTTLDRVYSVVAVDVDGDGDVDLLSGSSGNSKVAWYENNGAESFTERVVSTSISGGKDFIAADVDGDGDVDFLSASNYDDKIAWYENDGNQNFTQRVISTNANNALAVAAADLDGDGDLDVLSTSRFDDKVAWYENDGNQNFTERVISTKTNDAASLVVADLDNDGDLDVVASGERSNGTSGVVVWFENDGAENFSQRLLSANAESARSVFAADLDGDGDLDILNTSFDGDRIDWFENVMLFDFGDAPAPYPTTLAQDGARHIAVGPSFGANRDIETDGSPSSLANGDDGDDITIPSSLIVGRFNRINFRVEGGTARVDAWIDFNGDGSFNGPGEQIATSLRFDSGGAFPPVGLLVNVPSTAVLGTTYARFRVSTAGGLGPTGLALDGEVEDYRVTVVAAPAASSLLAIGTEGIASRETASSSHSEPPKGIMSEQAARDEAIRLMLSESKWEPSLVVDKRRDAPNTVQPREDAALTDEPAALDAWESAFSSLSHQWL